MYLVEKSIKKKGKKGEKIEIKPAEFDVNLTLANTCIMRVWFDLPPRQPQNRSEKKFGQCKVFQGDNQGYVR